MGGEPLGGPSSVDPDIRSGLEQWLLIGAGQEGLINNLQRAGSGRSRDNWLFDLELAWTYSHLRVALGAQNIGDVTPDQNLFANSNSGINRFPNNSPYGYNGRFVYSRMSYRF